MNATTDGLHFSLKYAHVIGFRPSLQDGVLLLFVSLGHGVGLSLSARNE